jgi:tetratricopeptide (TPR) repeat protein
MADASPPTHGDGTGETPTPAEARLEETVRLGREVGAFERLEAAYLGRDAFFLLARLYRERAAAAPLPSWRLELLARLAEVLESELGDEAGAAAVYGEMAQLGDEPALEEQLRLLRARSDRTGTWRALDLAVERARDKASRCHALTRRGWAALEVGEESAARSDFAAALSLVPGDLDALTGVVRVLGAGEDPAPLRALAHAVEQLSEGPERSARLRQLARMADARPGFAELSTRAWRGVAAAQPEDAEAAERLTVLLGGAGQEEALVGVLRGRLQRVPRGEGARGLRRQLVAALEQLGRSDEALEALRDAVRAEPGHHEAWIGLADRAEAGGRHAEFAWALEHAATSTVEPARRAHLWRRLGTFLARVPGKAEEARACIDRAVRLERALESGTHAMGPLTRMPRPRAQAAEPAELPPGRPAPSRAAHPPAWTLAPLTAEPTPLPGSSAHAGAPLAEWDDEAPLTPNEAPPGEVSTATRAPPSVPAPEYSWSGLPPVLPDATPVGAAARWGTVPAPDVTPVGPQPRGARDAAPDTSPRWGERPPGDSPTWGGATPVPDVTPVGPQPRGARDAAPDMSPRKGERPPGDSPTWGGATPVPDVTPVGPPPAGDRAARLPGEAPGETPVGPPPARGSRPASLLVEPTRILAPPSPGEGAHRPRGARPPSASEGQTRILSTPERSPEGQDLGRPDVTPVGPLPRGGRTPVHVPEPTRILAPTPPVEPSSRRGERPPAELPTWGGASSHPSDEHGPRGAPSDPERTPDWDEQAQLSHRTPFPDVAPVGPGPARAPALLTHPELTPQWGERIHPAPSPYPDVTPVGPGPARVQAPLTHPELTPQWGERIHPAPSAYPDVTPVGLGPARVQAPLTHPELTPQWGERIHPAPSASLPDVTPVGLGPARVQAPPTHPELTPQWGERIHPAPGALLPDVTPVGPVPGGAPPALASPQLTPQWGERMHPAPSAFVPGAASMGLPARAGARPPPGERPPGTERTATEGPSTSGGALATEPGLDLLPGPILEPDTWRTFADAVARSGDGWLASLAREAAQVLGGAPAESPPAPRWVLGPDARKGLQHPDLDCELAELLALAAPALVACSEQSAVSVVGAPFRAHAGPGAGEALDALALSVRILGLPSPRPELSTQPGPPFSVVAGAGDAVRLLVGSLAVRQPLPAGELRFFAGRALYTRQPLLRVLRLVPVDELEELLEALPGAVRGGGRLGRAERELRAQLPEPLREQLLPRLGSLEEEITLDALAMASRHAANRAGLAACGSVGAAVQALRAKRGLEEELEELLRFALSPAWRALAGGALRSGASAAAR